MGIKTITPVATEPVSLPEVKLHIRLPSDTVAVDTTTYQSIAPGDHVVAAAFSLVGTGVSVSGTTALVNLNAGTCGAGGSIAAKIQESDNNVDYTDWSTAFTTVTEANDNAVQEKAYTGTKAYIRVVATVAVATCDFSADVICKTGNTDEDTLLSMLITSARQWCENFTGLGLAPQTLELMLDGFDDVIELPFSPVSSVTSITYKDSTGTETTIAPANYIVDTDSMVGSVTEAYDYDWPTFTAYPVNPVRIRYVTGYTTCPAAIKLAMLLMIAYWYSNREAVGAIDNSSKEGRAVTSILMPYKVRWWE
jgi:uncharacterized phiE125 gp8 family phage protein